MSYCIGRTNKGSCPLKISCKLHANSKFKWWLAPKFKDTDSKITCENYENINNLKLKNHGVKSS